METMRISFEITTLELARGGPPLSKLLPSKYLLLKITKRVGALLPRSRIGEEADCKEAAEALIFKELQGRILSDEEFAFGFAEH
ncbi:hypothetical protein FF1_022346 [Malus domestica]